MVMGAMDMDVDVESEGVVREFAHQYNALLERLRSSPVSEAYAQVPIILRAIVDTERVDVLHALFNHTALFADSPAWLNPLIEYAAEGGRLAAVRWLHETVIEGVDCEVLNVAAQHGHVAVLRYFLDHPSKEFTTPEDKTAALEGAACQGRLDIVKMLFEQYGARCSRHGVAGIRDVAVFRYLVEQCSQPCADFALVCAVINGHVEVVQYLLQHQRVAGDVHHALMEAIRRCQAQVLQPLCEAIDLEPQNAELIEALDDAAARGYVDVIECVHRVHPQVETILPSLDGAAVNGHLDVVRFLAAIRSADCSTATVEDVAANGHMHILEFLHQHCQPEYTAPAMDRAASNGRLDVVKFLHEHSVAGCTTKAMDEAAANGHIAVVQFLHENRSEGCSKAAMCKATENGHLHVLQYLLHQDKKLCPCDCVYRAAANGHLKVVEFVMARRKSPWSGKIPQKCVDKIVANGRLEALQYLHQRHRNIRSYPRAMDLAAANGYLDMVKYLHEHQLGRFTTNAMDEAATNGHLDVVKFLHENRPEGCTTAAMDGAAREGHFDVVKFLHYHRHEGCTTSTMDYAAYHGNLHMVRFLHEHRTEGCSDAMYSAATNGHFAIVKFLNEQGMNEFAQEALHTATDMPYPRIARYLGTKFPEFMPY